MFQVEIHVEKLKLTYSLVNKQIKLVIEGKKARLTYCNLKYLLQRLY
jgi:hypothetical protein